MTATTNGHSPVGTRRLGIVPMGHTLSAFLVITYLVCLLLGFIVRDFGLHRPWLQFLPGFTWLTWQGFFIGLIESYAYGWYIAVVLVPLFNFCTRRAS